jgi:hypothetical protein
MKLLELKNIITKNKKLNGWAKQQYGRRTEKRIR